MSSTTVHSNTQEKAKIVASEIYFTEKTIEVPRDAKTNKINTLESGITSYIQEQGSLEIPAGNGMVNAKGEMTLQNGNVAHVTPEDVKTLAKYDKERKEKENKLQAKQQVEITR